MQLTSRVLKLLRKNNYEASISKDIYRQLKEPALDYKQLVKALDILESEEKIQKVGQKYIATTTGPDTYRGPFQANTKGFGFVLSPSSDIYIRSDRVNHALNGDLVEVRITRRKKRKNLEGVITRIIERAKKDIIGRVETRDNKKWLIPADRRVSNIFLFEDKADLADGQMVVGTIVKYPPKGIVQLKEVLGDENSENVETEVIIRQHDLRLDWPEDALVQASGLTEEIKKDDLEDRKDFRSDYIVTIDGLDAKDFDDAVSVKKKGDKYHLGVHIADVSAYVEKGSPLDEEAMLRGNSTYLPDRVLPMFPFELSNIIASLNPNVDRLTLSVESVIDKNGDILSFEINKGVINSKARLTYEQVDKSLKANSFANKEQESLLSGLLELQKILEKKRLARGSLFFETIEPKVILDEKQKPIDIEVRERTKATAIIEETMILTNEIVAKYMKKRRYPIIYREHEEPAEDALTELEGLLKSLKYPVKNLSSVSAKTYQQAIKFASNRDDRLLINSVLIRSMKKAKYSATETSHFGLGSKHYCHFTSPIRRYADLLVHRQVKKMLKNEFDFDKQELTGQLQEISENISLTEIESTAAERESKDLMIARFMKDKIGETFDAVITSITSFGFFVQIPNSAEGLIHMSALKDDYYMFEPDRYLVRGQRTGSVYRLGQKIKVQLINVTIGERNLDFEIAK